MIIDTWYEPGTEILTNKQKLHCSCTQGTHIPKREADVNGWQQCRFATVISINTRHVLTFFLRALGSYWRMLRWGETWSNLQISKTKKEDGNNLFRTSFLSPFLRSSAMYFKPLARIQGLKRVFPSLGERMSPLQSRFQTWGVIYTSKMFRNIVPSLWPCS